MCALRSFVALRFAAALLCLLPSLAMAGGAPPPGVRIGGPADTNTVTATGASASRSHAARAADVINVRDFGAKGDGVTDDAAAINAAFAYLRSGSRTIGGQVTARVVFPQGNYITGSSLNWTGLTTRAVTIEGGGAVITSKAAGKAAVDMLGSRFLRVRDLYILGDQTSRPKIGLLLGRTADTSTNSADNHGFENVYVDGYFSLASVYNLNSETVKWDHFFFWNRAAAGTYALIQDGINHFGVTSDFVTNSQPVDTQQSFNENLFLSCDFRTFGGGTPIWTAGASRHRFVSSYAANIAGAVGMELYSASAFDVISMLDLDLHFETGTLTDVFLLSGPATVRSLPGFRFRDQHPFATNSVFKLAAGITAATLHGADLDIGTMSASQIFDDPTKWMASGRAFLTQPALWNLPAAQFGGVLNLNGTVSVSGTFTGTLPTPLNVAGIASQGAVSAITGSGNGNYSYPSGATDATFPAVTIGSPATGGTQAKAHVATMRLNGFGTISAIGTGYSVNDLLNLSGGTFITAARIKVTSIDANGGVTGFSGSLTGSGYTAIPADPIVLSGGTGTGAKMSSNTWTPETYVLDAGGGGYTAPPAVTLATGTPAASATATVNSTFTATGGVGQLILDAIGTKLGTLGAAGTPVIAQGATIDGSGVRKTLNGTAWPVPANTSLVRFIQTSTVASQTITLPAPFADGQMIQFVQQAAGAVTALTFSPAVAGWTNGSQLNAGPGVGLRIRWDATAAAWYREQ